MSQNLTVYTDGSCLRNPGAGGWGAIMMFPDGSESELSGGHELTTNNRMEMMGVISALESLASPTELTIISDSQYIVHNIRGVETWMKRGWKGTNGKPVKNQDLWMKLYELCKIHTVTFQWVRGHNGNIGNERADVLASTRAKEYLH